MKTERDTDSLPVHTVNKNQALEKSKKKKLFKLNSVLYFSEIIFSAQWNLTNNQII